jgi:glyoxylase-like metal-dependent hydrolase (beta-lactamase superfamily II)
MEKDVMTPIFEIGDLQVVCVSDGILATSIDFVLDMTRDEALRISGAGEDGALHIPVNNFVFRRGDATILIDAGAGNTMQPTLGRLPQNLGLAGHEPASVTHILLTHLHPDHANGLVDDDGRAIFPNAELLVHETEFKFWTRDNDGSENESVLRMRARNKINLGPYRDRVRLMCDGEDMLGCSPILAPGHSPGHTCWKIETGRQALIAWGDLVHFSTIQISHPNTAAKYDLDPNLARSSRLAMLNTIARDRLFVAGAHVSAPGIGQLSKSDPGFVFERAEHARNNARAN